MTGDRDSEFSAAFDGMLDQNRQRLDKLYGGPADRPPSTAPRERKASPAATGRRAGRSEGRDFSFEV